MKRVNALVWGIVLLLAGLAFILFDNIIHVSGDITWPIILLGLSVVFHLYYFLSSGRNEGLLVPGGILLVYGLMFLAASQFSEWFNWGQMWPLFILGPALGLLELYVFSRGTKGSLIPVFILTVVGGGLLLMMLGVSSFGVICAIVLICVGVALMISAFVKGGSHGYKPQEVKPESDKKAE